MNAVKLSSIIKKKYYVKWNNLISYLYKYNVKINIK